DQLLIQQLNPIELRVPDHTLHVPVSPSESSFWVQLIVKDLEGDVRLTFDRHDARARLLHQIRVVDLSNAELAVKAVRQTAEQLLHVLVPDRLQAAAIQNASVHD